MSQLISIPFKEINTGNIHNYLVNPLWTTHDFKNIIKTKINTDFHISMNQFEIVEAGQNIEGVPAELAPAIPISDTIRINELFTYDIKYTAFYIRKINYYLTIKNNKYNEETLDNKHDDKKTIHNEQDEKEECTICYTLESDSAIYKIFGCSCTSRYCLSCSDIWVSSRLRDRHPINCPSCRKIMKCNGCGIEIRGLVRRQFLCEHYLCGSCCIDNRICPCC
jgi:hypothetical protein